MSGESFDNRSYVWVIDCLPGLDLANSVFICEPIAYVILGLIIKSQIWNKYHEDVVSSTFCHSCLMLPCKPILDIPMMGHSLFVYLYQWGEVRYDIVQPTKVRWNLPPISKNIQANKVHILDNVCRVAAAFLCSSSRSFSGMKKSWTCFWYGRRSSRCGPMGA